MIIDMDYKGGEYALCHHMTYLLWRPKGHRKLLSCCLACRREFVEARRAQQRGYRRGRKTENAEYQRLWRRRA